MFESSMDSNFNNNSEDKSEEFESLSALTPSECQDNI